MFAKIKRSDCESTSNVLRKMTKSIVLREKKNADDLNRCTSKIDVKIEVIDRSLTTKIVVEK